MPKIKALQPPKRHEILANDTVSHLPKTSFLEFRMGKLFLHFLPLIQPHESATQMFFELGKFMRLHKK
jgi:hypothetical protein